MNNTFNAFPFYYFAMLFTVISCIIAIVVGYNGRNKFLGLRFLYFYPLASVVQLIMAFCYDTSGLNCRKIVETISTNLFLLIEFGLIYYFFWQILKYQLSKNIMIITSGIYLLILLFFWTFMKGLFIFPADIFLIQALCIVILVCIYCFEIFKNPVVPHLVNEPSFWIAVGLVFYFGGTLPIFLMKDLILDIKGLIRAQDLYAINFISYGIMFLLITKAYLCKQNKA